MSSSIELLNLDEITHFHRDSRQATNGSEKSSLSHQELDMNGKGDKDLLSDKTNKKVSIVTPSTSKMSGSDSRKLNNFQQFSFATSLKSRINYDKAKVETGYSSDESDSDIEFSKKPNIRRGNDINSNSESHRSSCSSSNSSTYDHSHHMQKKEKKENENYRNFSVSDDNMLHIPSLNTVQVNRADGVFAFIVFITNLTEFVTDFTLVFWHFADGFKWASGITVAFMLTGSIGLLQQFSLLQRDHLERLFTHSRRIRIAVLCFPPLATIITSYQSSSIAFRSIKNPMLSNQFYEIEEFSKSLSKVQSFFQAAPLATVQLVVFIASIHEISLFKAIFMITNILTSLIVMTNANLPAKSDYTDMESLHRAAYIPTSRLFVGLRMLSNFCSRAMAITFLILGFRCLFSEGAMLDAVVVALFLMIIPRLIFTFIDYAHQLVTWRRQGANADSTPNRDSIVTNLSSRRSRSEISCLDTMLGYSATVFFPVGDPQWVFWYIWSETALFVLFGNVTGWTKSCLTTLVNAVYTSLFIVVFIIVPILIPYAKAAVKKRRMKRLDKIFDWKNNLNTTENPCATTDANLSHNAEDKSYHVNIENQESNIP